METDVSIRNALKRLMESSPYSSITIDSVVKEAAVSKKTLYRYYDNKDAIFDAIFRDLFVDPTFRIRESLDVDNIYSMPTLMLEQHYAVFYENRAIFENYYESRGMGGWIDLYCRNQLASNAKIYRQWGLDVSEAELDYVAYIVTVSGAAITAKWMDSGYKESFSELARINRKWVLSQFDVQRAANS